MKLESVDVDAVRSAIVWVSYARQTYPNIDFVVTISDSNGDVLGTVEYDSALDAVCYEGAAS